jgi:hypothetical protein
VSVKLPASSILVAILSGQEANLTQKLSAYFRQEKKFLLFQELNQYPLVIYPQPSHYTN